MDAAPPAPIRDRFGAALPIALTALATALAGLSTGELSRAMYWRSAAAQDQAKATDQWNFAGSKRDRSLIAETTAVTLRAVAGRPGPAAAGTTPLPAIVEQVNRWLRADDADPPVIDEAVRRVLAAGKARRPEAEVVRLAKAVRRLALDDAIGTAAAQAAGVEAAWDAEAGRLRTAVEAAGGPGVAVAQAARYDLDSRRYRAESAMNFWVGHLYEVRVAASTAESERHRDRSANFFYAMLAAQVGATVSSLALARRHKSALWTLAGLAGLVAVSFGGYVYLTM